MFRYGLLLVVVLGVSAPLLAQTPTGTIGGFSVPSLPAGPRQTAINATTHEREPEPRAHRSTRRA
jgi:hypothetical protein